MKKLLVCFLITTSVYSTSILTDVRKQFSIGISKEQTSLFIEQLEDEKAIEFQAYLAVMYFMKAKYVGFPTTKFKYFKKGKVKLNTLILKYPKNIEIRYLRFVLQHQTPSFLGYNNHIKEDFKIIEGEILNSILNKELKNQILKTMLLVEKIAEDKKERITNLLKNI